MLAKYALNFVMRLGSFWMASSYFESFRMPRLLQRCFSLLSFSRAVSFFWMVVISGAVSCLSSF